MSLLEKIFGLIDDNSQQTANPPSLYTSIDSHKWSTKISTIKRLSRKPTAHTSKKTTSSAS